MPNKLNGVLWLLPLVMLSMVAKASTEGTGVDANSGNIYVSGELTEAACRLDMDSVHQEISLGTVSTAGLNTPGDQSTPVAFQLRLKDCIRSSSGKRDNRSGSLIWNAIQPSVSVGFVAPADTDSPELVRVFGANVSGIGLRMTDRDHHDVRLGSWSHPYMVDPGQDELTFYIAPERTRAANLTPGAFHSSINFWMNYE